MVLPIGCGDPSRSSGHFARLRMRSNRTSVTVTIRSYPLAIDHSMMPANKVCVASHSPLAETISLRSVSMQKARALDDAARLGHASSARQKRKYLTEHRRSGGRKEAGATDHVTIVADEHEIGRIEPVVLVLFLVVLYVDVPV